MWAVLADWIAAERGRFVLLLPAGMGAAILVYFALPREPPLWLGVALAALAAAGLAAGWRHTVARFFAALALAGALGFARAEYRTASLPPLAHVPEQSVEILGTLGQVDVLPGGRRILLTQPRLNGESWARDIRVKLRADDTQQLYAGEQIIVYARLFSPDRPVYPGAWDAGRDDFFSRLGASGFALGQVKILAQPPARAQAWLQNLRGRIQQNIFSVLPQDTGAVAATLLTGDEQAIPPAERQNFIAAGLAHILAVAGLHVGIIMGLAFLGARFLLTRHERLALRLPVKPLAAGFALLAGAGYAALTGAHLPIMRALAMASLAVFGIAIGRRVFSLRGLALAAVLILLVTPEAIIGVSFQMSFSAVLALITGYEAARPWLRHGRTFGGRVISHVLALAFTSLLAGGASMPFAAYQFQQIQPYWIPANLIAVPLTAFWVLPWGLAALALMPLKLYVFPLIAMGWGIRIMLWLTAQISAWPEAMLRIPPVPDAAMLCVSAGLIWLCIWRTHARLAGLALILLGGVLYAQARPPDVLVSADARLIAIHAPEHQVLLLGPARGQDYLLGAWAPVWPRASWIFARCTQNICLDGPVMFAATRPDACPQARIAVSPEPWRGACGSMPALDREFAYHNGAAAAWINGRSVTLRTDRQVQGVRPWVVPYP